MNNPWEDIDLSDYENHMSLESVNQLQAMNGIMKDQFGDYPVTSAMVLGIAGGNGLEHVDKDKFKVVYGVDINCDYLKAVEERYQDLKGVLKCVKADITSEADTLPSADLLIANLFIEYVGYVPFAQAVKKADPKYVSCVIQINTDEVQWVSDSPYLHAFDKLDEVHHQMSEKDLTDTLKSIGYESILNRMYPLPNGKALQRLDFKKA